MLKRVFYQYLILYIVSCLAIGCSEKYDAIERDFSVRGDLISDREIGVLTTKQIAERITELNADTIVRYNVTYRAITYQTQYMNKPIRSSGLLLIPDTNEAESKLLMYCHGTELPSSLLNIEKRTPSYYRGEKEDYRDVRNMGLAWASAGYTVFIPDYIGFGITLGKDHPYVYYPEMFVSNIDGLLALKKLLPQHNFNKLYLTGWSQGAGAALSAHKYIQEGFQHEFTVIATSVLSGPYNFLRFAESFLEKKSEKIIALPIFSWGLYSLNKFSALRRPTDQLYNFSVFDQFSSILVPSFKPSDVFSEYFLHQWQKGHDVALIETLISNSFHEGWKPTGKVFLHHGNADDLIPVYNSEDAYNGLTAAGGIVKKYIYEGGGHDTELGNYIINTLREFNQLP